MTTLGVYSESSKTNDPHQTTLASEAAAEEALDIEYDDECAENISSLQRYEITEEIARGGMGVVYKSVDKHLCRDVAVKLLRRRYIEDESLRQRFLEEARITGQLQHPGIVPIYELGTCKDGRPFFAMKLVEGETLASRLSTKKGSHWDRSRHLNIFRQVCQTIAYANSRGVLHLDLKPSNVMVGTFGEVHVMDWGLCRTMDSSTEKALLEPRTRGDLTSHVDDPESATKCHDSTSNSSLNHILGTPAYMAPEQARGETVGPHCDVFGLGALLCEILTGNPPFCGDNLRSVYKASVSGALDHAFDALKACDGDEPVVSLARRCLASSPKDRPADTSMVASEITAYLESALQRAESDLARFFDISMDMFCIATLDGFFRRVNSNFSRVLGLSDRELVSRPFLDFVHPDDVQDTIDEMTRLTTGEPIVEFRNRYRDSDGNYHWMEWTAKPIPEENIVFAVARDVTNYVERGER